LLFFYIYTSFVFVTVNYLLSDSFYNIVVFYLIRSYNNFFWYLYIFVYGFNFYCRYIFYNYFLNPGSDSNLFILMYFSDLSIYCIYVLNY